MAKSPAQPGSDNRWKGLRVGITGIRGALGQALCRQFLDQGAVVVGLSHGPRPSKEPTDHRAQEWVQWSCETTDDLNPVLASLDLLVLNHGVNPGADQSSASLTRALTVNALSTWTLINRFEAVSTSSPVTTRPRELWINTSEAEIQPALSPGYELSKRLIGQLVSLRWSNQTREQRAQLHLRKLVLGPFRSDLNPIGVMTADWVAKQILIQANWNLSLIIVTPNPITYLLMPFTEGVRWIYNRTFNRRDP